MNFPDKKISIIIGIIFALVIVVYTATRFYSFLRGPTITINSPKNGEVFNAPLLQISGYAKQISFITLNDRRIFVDNNGHISEQLLLQNGYNIISIKASDRFGRKVERRLLLTYQQK